MQAKISAVPNSFTRQSRGKTVECFISQTISGITAIATAEMIEPS